MTMETRNLRKERIGVVVSDKMEKTIVVAEKGKEKHPIYGKIRKPDYQNSMPMTKKNGLQYRGYRIDNGKHALCQKQKGWRLVKNFRKSEIAMIQQESRCTVADNSGAKEALVIRVFRRNPQALCPLFGDKIVVTVKKCHSRKRYEEGDGFESSLSCAHLRKYARADGS